ncbi:hypothetical protein [Pyrobaculum aerophilum]|nr:MULTISPECIES: hypothetical protein [Pyrobaculum]MCX8136912.1 hypothetical protein [Pyrobaculum aerophilum]
MTELVKAVEEISKRLGLGEVRDRACTSGAFTRLKTTLKPGCPT